MGDGLWQLGMDPSGLLMSEKFDGLGATWDGRDLRSRNGNRFAAPEWFTAQLPDSPLDGELWAGRGRFQFALSVCSSETPDERWSEIRYMVFTGGDAVRPGDHVGIVEERPCGGADELEAALDEVTNGGGEGLMLRDSETSARWKVKRAHDAEGVVVGHTIGKGKFAGRCGALILELPNGERFKLSSGLCDADRDDPPPVGAVVTFQYQGLTDRGVPRIARFLRVRGDLRFAAVG